MILALHLNMNFREALCLGTAERGILLRMLERLRGEAKDQLDETDQE